MKRFFKWTLIIIALFFGVVTLVDLILGPEDSCMDSGGCWDSTDRVCRKNEPNAQELCDRVHSN